MKKTLMALCGMSILALPLKAQNWNEWFRQKKTQKQYLIQQIAALKVYAGYLKEGYDIAKKGLGMIGDIKGGNFGDHQDYFASLKAVSPAVRNSPKLSAIVRLQSETVKESERLRDMARESEWFSSNEVRYIISVHENMMRLTDQCMHEVRVVITDDASQMTDDERLSRVDLLYEKVKEQHAFIRSFYGAASLLIMQRSHENFEGTLSEQLTNQGL